MKIDHGYVPYISFIYFISLLLLTSSVTSLIGYFAENVKR